jgi:hypothetical protein
VPLEVVDIERPAAATFYGDGPVLSRPDQHAAWSDAAELADSLALIGRVRGARTPTQRGRPPGGFARGAISKEVSGLAG